MEQQSSRILPLVIFEEYIDVFGLEKDHHIGDVRTLVKSYFKKWKNVQHANGGFPYWPDDSRFESFYVSLRLAHIAALAKQRGYTDSEIAYDVSNLMSYLENQITNPKYHFSDFETAMYYYVRSLLGIDVSKSKLEGLYAKTTDISVTSLVGMTYPVQESELISDRVHADLIFLRMPTGTQAGTIPMMTVWLCHFSSLFRWIKMMKW